MLGKLFKYDMKQISRIMLPLVLLTFGTTLFGTAALKTVNEVVVPMESGVAQNVLLSSLYMVFGISVFVLCAFAVMAILFTVARFYKNLFTDEGYLTFTLPVTLSPSSLKSEAAISKLVYDIPNPNGKRTLSFANVSK